MFKRPFGRLWFSIIIIINCFIIVLIGFKTYYDFREYQRKIDDQMINELIRVNDGSGEITYRILEDQQNIVNNYKKYIEASNFTYNEVLEFFRLINTDAKVSIQLINTTNTIENKNQINKGVAFFADGSEVIVDYSNDDFRTLQNDLADYDKIEKHNKVNVIGRFTESCYGISSIAVHSHITLDDETDVNLRQQAIMIVIESDFLNNQNIWLNKYHNVTPALIAKDGSLIANHYSISSQNYFSYLDGMSFFKPVEFDEFVKKITDDVNGEGYYISHGANGNYVFVYSLVEKDLGWYVVSYISEEDLLASEENVEFNSIIFNIVCFTILLSFNMTWLLIVNKYLKNNLVTLNEANNAKTNFLSRMSHDMRTPMNGILGMSELGMESNSLEEVKEYLKNINDSGKYLLSLINDTLDMNKIESGKMTLNESVVNLEEYIDNILSSFNLTIFEKDMLVEVQKKCKLNYYVLLDEVRVKQVINNILSNAFKFTPNGGRIIFEIDGIIEEDKFNTTIKIIDTGIGMSESYLHHIFEPFSQERSNIEKNLTGTGLGMSIVKNLLELMKGNIIIESELNKGTAVIISLDLKITDKVNEENLVTYDSQILKNKKILLVEDHPMNIVIITKILENAGMIVDSAENGLKAIEMFENMGINYYDAIIMDIRMPVMDGLEATRRIRKIDSLYAKNITIIAMTANAFDLDINDCFAAGMNEHLVKPVDTKKLYVTLCNHLNKTRN